LEEANGLACDARRKRIVERNGRPSNASGNDDVNLGIPNRMPQSLTGSQVEHGSVDVGNRQLAFRKNAAQFFSRCLLDRRRKAVQSGEAFELVDQRASDFHPGVGFQLALLYQQAISSEDHPQARQRTGVILLLLVEWKLDTHSTFASFRGLRRSAGLVRR